MVRTQGQLESTPGRLDAGRLERMERGIGPKPTAADGRKPALGEDCQIGSDVPQLTLATEQ
jgi:hypothetical protein